MEGMDVVSQGGELCHPSLMVAANFAMPVAPQPLFPSTSSTSALAGPIRKRRFSGAKIQPTRVKKVMQSDEEIGRMVASVPVAIGRAMEHFAEKLLLAAAAAVAQSSSRTLSPVHMKMAMLANPHFAFLEPLLKDVGLPSRPGEAYASIPRNIQAPIPASSSTSFEFGVDGLAAHPDTPVGLLLAQRPAFPGGCAVEGAVPTVSPLNSPLISPAAPRVYRRSSSNGTGMDGVPVEKKPRGRPRKMKKDKCVEDDMLVEESSALLPRPLTHYTPPDTDAKDRELMPPPALPFGRFPPPPSS